MVNGWLLVQNLLDFEQCPTAFPDLVRAGLRVASVGTSSVRYDVGLFANDPHEASAQGHFVHVYVDRVTRRPVPFACRLRPGGYRPLCVFQGWIAGSSIRLHRHLLLLAQPRDAQSNRLPCTQEHRATATLSGSLADLTLIGTQITLCF